MIIYRLFKTGEPQRDDRPPGDIFYEVVANRPENTESDTTYRRREGPFSGSTLEACGLMAERAVADHLDFVSFPHTMKGHDEFRVAFNPPYDKKLIRRPFRDDEVRHRQTYRLNELERRTVMEASAQELARRADELEEEFNEEMEEADGLGIFDEDVVAEGVDS